jgi:hypothetical protein
MNNQPCNHDFPAGSEYAPEARCSRCHKSRAEVGSEARTRVQETYPLRSDQEGPYPYSPIREITRFEQT